MISWSSTTLLLDGDKAEISTIKTVNFQLLTGHRKSSNMERKNTTPAVWPAQQEAEGKCKVG